jgi:predicted transposase/invertase (TIGR01784 family)
MKFVNPKNDIAFKKIFGDAHHTEILISFLNAVLGLEGERQINTIELLNPYQAPQIDLFKESILDIYATDHRGVTFIVEMQVEHLAGLMKRFLFYAAKAYVSQIERGENYPRLNQVILVGILDFAAFEGTNYLTHHQIVNTATYRQEIADLAFAFIELPKFTKTADEVETVLEKWVYFLKHAYQLDAIPSNVQESPLHTAYEQANAFGWSRDELEIYDYWSIKAQDARGGIEYALEEGERKGREEGERNRNIAIARSMLAKGIDVKTVMECTGLSAEELDELTSA